MLTEDELYSLIMRSNDNLYSVTHNDFDGIASAAVLVHYTGMRLDRVFFNPSVDGFASVHESLIKENPHGSTIVFTDLSISDGLLGRVSNMLKFLKSNNNTVAWIDHHQLSEEVIFEASELCDFIICGEDPKHCATELIYNILSRSDQSAKEVADTAHLIDFNLMDNKNKELMDSLACSITFINYSGNPAPGLRKLVDIVSKGELRSTFIKDLYSKYMKEAEANTELLKRNARSFKAGDYTIGIGYGKHIQSSAACATIHDKLNTDINVFIKTDIMSMSIRSDAGADCSILARALGGGGHPQAAGAQPPGTYNPDDKIGMDKMIEYVISTARSIYSRKK